MLQHCLANLTDWLNQAARTICVRQESSIPRSMVPLFGQIWQNDWILGGKASVSVVQNGSTVWSNSSPSTVLVDSKAEELSDLLKNQLGLAWSALVLLTPASQIGRTWAGRRVKWWNGLNLSIAHINLICTWASLEWTRVARSLKSALPSPWTVFTHWQRIYRHWQPRKSISLSEDMKEKASLIVRWRPWCEVSTIKNSLALSLSLSLSLSLFLFDFISVR